MLYRHDELLVIFLVCSHFDSTNNNFLSSISFFVCGSVVLSFRQVRNRTAAIGPSVSGVSPDRTSSPVTTGNTRALNPSAARSASAASPAPIISPSTWNVTYPKAPNAKTNKRITTTVLYSRTHYNEVSVVVGRRRPLNHHIIWLSPPPEWTK